jgi:hypothetical protein
MKNFDIQSKTTRSIFRRKHYKFLKSEPKKVFIQILVQAQQETVEKTQIFEVNVDGQACQRVYLDDRKELYVIC